MKQRLSPALEKQYPNLKPDGYRVTSKKNKKYNCVGWAAVRDVSFWWEPLKEPGCCWPKGVPVDHAFENYVKVFEMIGYAKDANPSLEEGVEKVALFKDIYGFFTHAAHQLEDGEWVSKLGPDEDIKHKNNQVLESFENGMATTIMKRKRQIFGIFPTSTPQAPELDFF